MFDNYIFLFLKASYNLAIGKKFIREISASGPSQLYDKLYLAYNLAGTLFKPTLSLQQRKSCLKFLFGNVEIRPLIAGLARGGLHWTANILKVAFDLENGGSGEYYFENNSWLFDSPNSNRVISHLDFRLPLGQQYTQNPIFYRTGQSYYAIPCQAKSDMRVAILVRNLYNQQKSRIYHSGYSRETERAYFKDEWLLRDIGFLNSWGEYHARFPERCIIIKYEDLLNNTFKVVKPLAEFLQLKVSDDSLHKAIERCTKLEMKKRIPQESQKKNIRVTLDSKEDPFSEWGRRFLKDTIQKKLKYDFGYDYSSF